MEPSRTPRFGGDPTGDDAAELLASNQLLMRELVDEVKKLREKQPPPPSEGNGSRARIINAVVTIALGAALGAHALLWYLDKTVAVHTTLIERVMEDVRIHQTRTEREYLEFRNRVRELERGRDR